MALDAIDHQKTVEAARVLQRSHMLVIFHIEHTEIVADSDPL
jgi:hypothetical protein